MVATGTEHGPLRGIRVIDTTKVLAGPYCSMILADLGAEVIKVERPPYGDPSRFVNQPRLGYDSAYFMAINRGKKSVVLDLANDEGREAFMELVEHSDVYLENNRPETSGHLGIDYESLRARNPRIIACAVSGFGQTGPDRDQVGLDLSIQARSGLMSLTGTGEPGSPPLRLGLPMGDVGAGMWAALGVLAALQRRETTGEGAYVDVALLDCAVALTSYMAANCLASGEDPEPVGSGHHNAVPYQAFPTSDGWVVVACYASLVFWERFCSAIERMDIFDVPRYKTNLGRVEHKAELVAQLEQVFKERPTAHWCAVMKQVGIPASPVNGLTATLEDEQLVSREMIATMHHPEHGDVRVVGNPIHFGDWRTGTEVAPAPRLGEHTESTLQEVLGRSAEEVARLISSGAARGLAQHPVNDGILTPA